MLEFVKKVLQGVSFDKELFRKELFKNLLLISPAEKALLMSWCLAHFTQHYDVLKDAFRL
jgi:hypothetical protein